jgi:ABC-type antimicrobial peptide transport system permease subunit
MDQYSAMFALGKKLGDTLTVPDSAGQPVTLQLVALLNGSLLQGNVIVPENEFIRLFPDTGGSRFFLIDAPAGKAETFRRTAIDLLGPRGLTLVPAGERLAQFQAVQNTYLTIFSTLGGLALILAAVGLAILVARNVLERRSEFAVLQSAGFTTAQLRRMILAEHWFLLVAGVALGALAALLAVWPNLKLAGSHGLPIRLLASLLLALLGGGLLFCWSAARLALSRRLVDALRHE